MYEEENQNDLNGIFLKHPKNKNKHKKQDLMGRQAGRQAGSCPRQIIPGQQAFGPRAEEEGAGEDRLGD